MRHRFLSASMGSNRKHSSAIRPHAVTRQPQARYRAFNTLGRRHLSYVETDLRERVRRGCDSRFRYVDFSPRPAEPLHLGAIKSVDSVLFGRWIANKVRAVAPRHAHDNRERAGDRHAYLRLSLRSRQRQPPALYQIGALEAAHYCRRRLERRTAHCGSSALGA